MPYEWKDTVVLITGAATGIGSAVVKTIVNEGVKHVAVLDIAEAAGTQLQNELNSKYGNKIKFYKCDVTDEKALLGTFQTVKDEQGYIDVVINNAGIMNDSPRMYRKEIDINVTALVAGTVTANEMMRKDKGGHGGTVMNISSGSALIQAPFVPIYYGTKSFILQFSNCIGMKENFSRTGVRVLAICFGLTNTSIILKEKVGCLNPEDEQRVIDFLANFYCQSADSAARGLVDAYKLGESGSTWLVANDKPAEDITGNVQKAYEIMSKNVTQSLSEN